MTTADLAWRRDTASALATNSQLGHLVGCNGFFTALIRSARYQRQVSLAEWWSARRCARAWGDAVRPDGYAVWVEGDIRFPFCFDNDRRLIDLGRPSGLLPTPGAAAGHSRYGCSLVLALSAPAGGGS